MSPHPYLLSCNGSTCESPSGGGCSLAGGNNIYSMFEAGFGSGTQPKPCGGTAGRAMSGTYGECDGGLSVELCELHLAAICPGACRDLGGWERGAF